MRKLFWFALVLNVISAVLNFFVGAVYHQAAHRGMGFTSLAFVALMAIFLVITKESK